MNLINAQVEIEERYSRRNIRSWIKEELMSDESMVYALSVAYDSIQEYLLGDYYPSKNRRYITFREYNDIEPIMMEVMVEVLQAREGRSIFQQIAGKVSSYVKGMDYLDAVKTVSDIMGLMCHANLFDVIQPAMAEEGVLIIQSDLTLDDAMFQRIANTKYLPPMLVKPAEISTNIGFQYLSFPTSLIKKKHNQHFEYIAYDVINILQSYQLSLDKEVVFNEVEVSKKPLDTQEKKDNFLRMSLASKATYLETLEYGNKFFIPWSYDKRGRSYMDGYHINYQSTEYKKALIKLKPLKVNKTCRSL